MPKEEKCPRVVAADVERYLSLEAERLDLNRQAKDKKRLADEIETKLWTWVEHHGGEARCKTLADFLLAIKTEAGRVSWADEFVRVAGEEEAQRLRKACPPREYFTVERIR